MISSEKVTIRKLTTEDYPIVKQCITGIANLYADDLFLVPDSDYIYKILSGYGFSAGAFFKSTFIGFASVVFPKSGKHNIGHLLCFNYEQLLTVAQIEHVFVLPEYRAEGIAEQLLNFILSKLDLKYSILLSTVAPQNTPSLSLAFKLGQRIVSYLVVYGVNRFIMVGIRGLQEIPHRPIVVEISRNEIYAIDAWLKSGYEGVSFGKDKTTLRFISRQEIL